MPCMHLSYCFFIKLWYSDGNITLITIKNKPKMRQLRITNSITNRESSSLDKYLTDISREKLISVDEEVELALRIRKGDKNALNNLVKANLRFVVSVAKQYQNQGLSLPDLINEGNLGLIKAAEKFDETRGFKFVSYAVWWIRQSILAALAEQSRVVRLPLNQVAWLNKINKSNFKLEQENECSPSAEEIAEEIDFPVEKVESTLMVCRKHVSFDSPIYSEGTDDLYEITEDEESLPADARLMKASLSIEVERSLSIIKERDSTILKMSFGIGEYREMSIPEIAKELGLSAERIRQLKERAIKKMRSLHRSKNLIPYLG